ncbi:hypothetical protein [Paenibacillus sp.]|uniref:hypothetical protein n=1 Tax=Paenibacillus sp. TaxID=58172 RepID=UPI0028125EDE|nr:hypothetical protein [Paenibacillus sp.]
MASAHRYTKEPAYLADAGRVADFFLEGVPEGAVRILKSVGRALRRVESLGRRRADRQGGGRCHQKRQVSLIYGDFFFAEALQKAATGHHFFW